MSKTGWIILIVCLCLVFCLCAGLFLAGRISTWLFRDRSETRVDTGTTKEYKDLKNDYSADGVYTVQTKDLKELTIDWISGSVIVEITDTRIKSQSELEETYGYSVVGVIPSLDDNYKE